jgi:ubiquitin carboxyl-terminal hydrolase 14
MPSDLTGSLRDLFKQMSQTQDSFPPLMFLNALRTTFPQFAQRSRDGHGYAQQDAEEAWSQIISTIRPKLKSDKDSAQFIDRYLSGTFETVETCDDPAAIEAGEIPVEAQEKFLKLECHITGETNHLRDGIATSLVEHREKRSSALDRNATYTKTSKIKKLPKYLTVHFMRFDWRRDTSKKAKILRKVTFPQELDAVEFCSDELQKKLHPVRNKFRDVRSLEVDAERAKKRQKRADEQLEIVKKEEKKSDKGKEKKKADDEDVDMDATFKTDAELDAERQAEILTAKKDLIALIDAQEVADDSANHIGLYELRGIITHQGISADSGHYTAFVKKTAKGKDPITGKDNKEDGKWWWFNDDKVTEFDAEKIETLSGGGK